MACAQRKVLVISWTCIKSWTVQLQETDRNSSLNPRLLNMHTQITVYNLIPQKTKSNRYLNEEAAYKREVTGQKNLMADRK